MDKFVPKDIDVAPSAKLEVTFADGTKLNYGTEVKPANADKAPTVTWSTDDSNKNVIDKLKDLPGGIADGLGHIGAGLKDGIGQLPGGLKDGIENLPGGIKDGFGHISAGLKDQIGQLPGGLKDGIGNLPGGIKDGIGHIGAGIKDGIDQLPGGIKDGIGQLPGGIKDGIGHIGAGLKDLWSSYGYKSGGDDKKADAGKASVAAAATSGGGDKKDVTTSAPTLYTLYAVDSGASPETCHWLVTNIPGAQIDKGNTVAPYFGPKPPSEATEAVNYLFLSFKQSEKIPELPAIDTRPLRQATTMKDFVAKYKLGNPVAGNYATALPDDSSKEFWASEPLA